VDEKNFIYSNQFYKSGYYTPLKWMKNDTKVAKTAIEVAKTTT